MKIKFYYRWCSAQGTYDIYHVDKNGDLCVLKESGSWDYSSFPNEAVEDDSVFILWMEL